MSLLLSGMWLLFMGNFDFNQISNIDTLKCCNFLRMALLHLCVTWKALQLPSFFFSFSFSSVFLDQLFNNILTLVTNETFDQNLTHSFDTAKGNSTKIVPEVVIRDTCGTWHSLFMVSSICSIQKSTRNYLMILGSKLASKYVVDDRRFKNCNRKKLIV